MRSCPLERAVLETGKLVGVVADASPYNIAYFLISGTYGFETARQADASCQG